MHFTVCSTLILCWLWPQKAVLPRGLLVFSGTVSQYWLSLHKAAGLSSKSVYSSVGVESGSGARSLLKEAHKWEETGELQFYRTPNKTTRLTKHLSHTLTYRWPEGIGVMWVIQPWTCTQPLHTTYTHKPLQLTWRQISARSHLFFSYFDSVSLQHQGVNYMALTLSILSYC